MNLRRVLHRVIITGALVAACVEEPLPPGPPPPPSPPPAPPPPDALTATAGPVYNAITLQFTTIPGATYNLYWRTTPDVSPQNGTRIEGVTPGFQHTGLTAGTTYYYVVTAVATAGESAPTPVASAVASADIAIRIRIPALGSLSDTLLGVFVTIQSQFQLAGVTAQVGTHSVSLHYVQDTSLTPSAGWAGNIALSGLARGLMPLQVQVTDANGAVANGAVPFFYDQKPRLGVSQPAAMSVARPGVRIVASCQDDDPAGCDSITVGVKGEGDRTLAGGSPPFEQVVSLASYDGQYLILMIRGVDRSRQVNAIEVPVYVDGSTSLVSVATVDGFIYDVQPDRILFVDNTGGALKIRNVTAGTTEFIYQIVGPTLTSPFLTPVGAAFVTKTGSTTDVLYSWENGVLAPLGGLSPTSLVVRGPFGIWRDDGTGSRPLYRRNFVTGGTVQIDPAALSNCSEVAVNGDVVYERGGDIFRYVASAPVRLTTDGGNTCPVTDGSNVVFRQWGSTGPTSGFRVRHIGPSVEQALTPFDTPQREPLSGYRATNGWIAYTKAGTAGEQQVWTRSPAGVDAQVSQFSTSSVITALGPNGEVVFRTPNGLLGRQYLSTPPYATARDIGSYNGTPVFLDGVLFVYIGRELFRVN